MRRTADHLCRGGQSNALSCPEMARILYGVHGTGHGHAVRALAVARHFGAHEFLFVSHGDGASILRAEGFQVGDIPNPETVVTGHRVRAWPTLASLLKLMTRRSRWDRAVQRLLDDFHPDLTMTDYEYFVPRVARRTGVPCVSLDHQHIVPLCAGIVPKSRAADFAVTAWSIRTLFSQASTHLVSSFFSPSQEPRDPDTQILPALLRETVLQAVPHAGDFVLAYQGYSTFARFLPLLKRIPRPVRAYGLPEAGHDDNVEFKPRNEREFLQDLAGCRYVVCGGGHSLISEALHLGKPVVAFPVRQAIEQYLNAWYVQHLGFGLCVESFSASNWIDEIESRQDEFQTNIRQHTFAGNDQIHAEIKAALAGR